MSCTWEASLSPADARGFCFVQTTATATAFFACFNPHQTAPSVCSMLLSPLGESRTSVATFARAAAGPTNPLRLSKQDAPKNTFCILHQTFSNSIHQAPPDQHARLGLPPQICASRAPGLACSPTCLQARTKATSQCGTNTQQPHAGPSGPSAATCPPPADTSPPPSPSPSLQLGATALCAALQWARELARSCRRRTSSMEVLARCKLSRRSASAQAASGVQQASTTTAGAVAQPSRMPCTWLAVQHPSTATGRPQAALQASTALRQAAAQPFTACSSSSSSGGSSTSAGRVRL